MAEKTLGRRNLDPSSDPGSNPDFILSLSPVADILLKHSLFLSSYTNIQVDRPWDNKKIEMLAVV